MVRCELGLSLPYTFFQYQLAESTNMIKLIGCGGDGEKFYCKVCGLLRIHFHCSIRISLKPIKFLTSSVCYCTYIFNLSSGNQKTADNCWIYCSKWSRSFSSVHMSNAKCLIFLSFLLNQSALNVFHSCKPWLIDPNFNMITGFLIFDSFPPSPDSSLLETLLLVPPRFLSNMYLTIKCIIYVWYFVYTI